MRPVSVVFVLVQACALGQVSPPPTIPFEALRNYRLQGFTEPQASGRLIDPDFAGNFHEILQEATVHIIGGHSDNGVQLQASAYIIGKPDSKHPDRGHYMLVGTNHAFRDMPGETVAIRFRLKVGGSVMTAPMPLKIRDGKRELWFSQPNLDIAVIPVSIPDGLIAPLLPSTVLASKEKLQTYSVGQQVMAAGFPHGAEAGAYAILRQATITSHSLDLERRAPTFQATFAVYPGDSGGAIYSVGRSADGRPVITILGTIIQSTVVPDTHQHIGIATVVGAPFILELIEKLNIRAPGPTL